MTYRYANRMTTLAVRVPDTLLEGLDSLVDAGRFPNRTAAVRAALGALLEDERRQEVDRAIIDGYTRKPPERPDALTRALAERSIELEPW
jgi:Arc/MetJ-type ribon-helix-helix transcriptional regulator